MAIPRFRNALPLPSMLMEYHVEEVLGAGGFGITYRAKDTNLDKDVAIKEYLPGELAMRAPDGNVVAQATHHEAGYQWGLERFLLEARTLAKFSHPNIVRVLRYFEANATGYMVMDYESGDSLKTKLQLDPNPPEEKLRALIAPLLDGLAAVHATGFLHRDIKPDNIFVRADGSPVLIDFGAARQAMGGETKSLTAILTPGYAPLEQYSGEGKQGPWTDLYAMGGVLYRAVTDKNPPDAVTRVRGDSLGTGLSGARGKYGAGFLQAIELALALEEKKRPQSVAEWRGALLGGAETVIAKTAMAKIEVLPRAVPQSRPERRHWPIGVASVSCALAILVALTYWNKHRASNAAPPPSTAPASAEALPAEQFKRMRERAESDFRAADTNRDGYVTLEEAQNRLPMLVRRFRQVDRDGDGRVSLQEFMQAERMLEQRQQRQGK